MNLYLGDNPPDADPNGQPEASAGGETADEGGITFSYLDASSTSLTATIPYYNNSGTVANITGWMDINRDNMFSAGEGVTTTTTVSNGAGSATLTFTGLTGLVQGQQYFLRFRTSTETISVLDIGGEFSDGEVEDYMATVLFPLPVSFAGFAATVQDCRVSLKWKTVTESNSESYAVEWSKDGSNFTELAIVPSRNNASGAEYQYGFEAGQDVTNYFRLRAIDFDGRFEYSNIITVANPCAMTSLITLSPNPVSSVLNIRGLSVTDRIVLMDMSGTVINVRQSVVTTGTLNTSELGKGVYIIKVISQQGKESIHRFVKN